MFSQILMMTMVMKKEEEEEEEHHDPSTFTFSGDSDLYIYDARFALLATVQSKS